MQIASVRQFTAVAQAVAQVSYDQREWMAQLLQAGFERKAIFPWNYTLVGTERKTKRCNQVLQNNEGLAGYESEQFAENHKLMQFRSPLIEKGRSGRFYFLFLFLLSHL